MNLSSSESASETELILKRSAKFTQSTILTTNSSSTKSFSGGIIKKGQLSWFTNGSNLEIFSLRNGQKITNIQFDYNLGFERCFITCLTEIEIPGTTHSILAIGIQFQENPGSIVVIFSVEESKILRCIEIRDKITHCCFVHNSITSRTVLQMLNGCLAIGTDTGKVILLDLDLEACEEALYSVRNLEENTLFIPCHIVSANLDFIHLREHCKQSKQQNVNFAIELEELDNASIVLSMLCITPMLCLAVGFEDGRMLLYDLSELIPFHLAYPPSSNSPLVKFSYMEPPDDPRACMYIWAFHENPDTSSAVMHSVVYDKKLIEEDGTTIYEGFETCHVRLTLPMYDRGSLPLSCHAITKSPSQDEEETISCCLLAWKYLNGCRLLVFDLNQWYKEQMPNIGDWRENPNYLACFTLENYFPMDARIAGQTITPFNSMNRPEEHFYPISLSFDCVTLYENEINVFHWPGLQNRALETLISGGPVAMLEPAFYFSVILKASLIPQFTEFNNSAAFSLNVQREVLLSVALEYNCFGLLKECARSWADGSYLGKRPMDGLSLSTLTEWIWNRAVHIKNRCNTLCIPLFDHSGFNIDRRSQKELSHLSRQMKLLTELFDIILTKCKEYIPEAEIESLTLQCNSVRMASEYQEVLQWLLNIGLLPEAPPTEDTLSSKTLVPYPYKTLRGYYHTQRARFAELNKGLISSRTQSCRILYIDSFIEHECNANVLRDHWLESGGDGLYPPPSMQAMLRALLVPDVSIESVYVLLIYFFLDLSTVVEDDRHAPIVQNLIKFPAVFKLNASLIKTVQAFWNLDHGHFEVALEEIISPFSQERKLLQWQQELLIEALLAQDQPNLALRVLKARASPISSLLELKTLLANDLIAEAFHFQRSNGDNDLFKTFLRGCLLLGKWAVLRDLALTEEENRIIEEFLREVKSTKAESLHFVNLLQRSKYVEAISYLEGLSKQKQNQRTNSIDLETPSLVLSAYNLTMTPAIRDLSETYYHMRNKIKPKDPVTALPSPLSCELLKNCNNIVSSGGIYHSSILSTDQATNYWNEKIQKEPKRLTEVCNAPFVRHPQLDLETEFSNIKETISYPETYKCVQKRRLNESSSDSSFVQEYIENPRKKRALGLSGSSVIRFNKLNSSSLTKIKSRGKNRARVMSVNDGTPQKSNNLRRENSEISTNLLSTPIIKSVRIGGRVKESDLLNISRSDRTSTPHSILKGRKIIRPTTSLSRQKLHDQEEIFSCGLSLGQIINNRNEPTEEEKSIRFNLPNSRRSTISLSQSPSVGSPERKETSFEYQRSALPSASSSMLSVKDESLEFYSPVNSPLQEIHHNPSITNKIPKITKLCEEMESPQRIKYCEEMESDEDTAVNENTFKGKTKDDQKKVEDVLLQEERNIYTTKGPRSRPPIQRSFSPEDVRKTASAIVTKSDKEDKTDNNVFSTSNENELQDLRSSAAKLRGDVYIERKRIETIETKRITKLREREVTKVTEKRMITGIPYSRETKSYKFSKQDSSSEIYKSPQREDISNADSETSLSGLQPQDMSLRVLSLAAPPQILCDESAMDVSINTEANIKSDSTLIATMETKKILNNTTSLEAIVSPPHILCDSSLENEIEPKKTTQVERLKEMPENKDNVNDVIENTSVDKSASGDKSPSREITNKPHAEKEYSKETMDVAFSPELNLVCEENENKVKDGSDQIEDLENVDMPSAEKIEMINAALSRGEDTFIPDYDEENGSGDSDEDEEQNVEEEQDSNVESLSGNEEDESDESDESTGDEDEQATDSEDVISISSSDSGKNILTEKQASESFQCPVSPPNSENMPLKKRKMTFLDHIEVETDLTSIEPTEVSLEESMNEEMTEGLLYADLETATYVHEEDNENNINIERETQKEELIYAELFSHTEVVSSGQEKESGASYFLNLGDSQVLSDTKENLNEARFEVAQFTEVELEENANVMEDNTESVVSAEITNTNEGAAELNKDCFEISEIKKESGASYCLNLGDSQVLSDTKENLNEARFEVTQFTEVELEKNANIMEGNTESVVSAEITNTNEGAAELNKDCFEISEIRKEEEEIQKKEISEDTKPVSELMQITREDGTQVENDSNKTDTTNILDKAILQDSTDTEEFHSFTMDQNDTADLMNVAIMEKTLEIIINESKKDENISKRANNKSTVDESTSPMNLCKRESPSEGKPEPDTSKKKEESPEGETKETESSPQKDVANSTESVNSENKVALRKRRTSESTPERQYFIRARRARSESVDIALRRGAEVEESIIAGAETRANKEFTRAKSVSRVEDEEPLTPKSNLLSRKLKRHSTSDRNSPCLTPTHIITRRQSQLLERIEEDSILDSPARHTRSKTNLNSSELDLHQQSSPAMSKRTRKTSTSSSIDTIPETSNTPRTTRSRSVLSEDNTQSTPKRLTKRGTSQAKELKENEAGSSSSSSMKARKLSEEFDNKSEKKSGKAKNSNEDKVEIVENVENVEDAGQEAHEGYEKPIDYSTTRRLTRHQRAVLEKSAALMPSSTSMEDSIVTAQKRILTRRSSKMEDSPRQGSTTTIDESPRKAGQNESETESVTSGRSKRSISSRDSRRVMTRSQAKLEEYDDNDDTSSIASSVKSGRTRHSKTSAKLTKKGKQLNPIQEEENSEEKKTEEHSSDESIASTKESTKGSVEEKKPSSSGRSRRKAKT